MRGVEKLGDYYPFGLSFNSWQRGGSKKNDYLYNGKEMQDELDLGWMDYGARMYDGSIGRWHVVDPLSEIDFNQSIYIYGKSNPINRTDPNGMISITILGEELKGKEKRKIMRSWRKEYKIIKKK